MIDTPAARSPRGWTTNAFGLGASLLLHVAFYVAAIATAPMPIVDFEIELPMNAELGLSEASKAALPPPSGVPEPPPEPEPTAAHAAPAVPVEPAEPKRARQDAGTPDAAVHDAAVADASTLDAGVNDSASRDAAADAQTNDASTADSGAASAVDAATVSERQAADAGAAQLAAFAPAGTQISLRLHMAALRDSPLAPDLQRLLAAIPDWQALLDGSGVDPLQDLERLLLATPNLSRSSVVLAGEHRADPELPRRAVAQLAAARGVDAPWKRKLGYPVARWANRDETERIVALLGNNLFAITRPDDLERILAVAQGLAERAARERKRDASVPPSEALLALPEGEVLHFGVEGVRQFVRGRTQGIPQRLEGGVSMTTAGPARLNAQATFEGPAEAEVARTFWQGLLDNVARQPIVALLGLASAVRSARLEVGGSALKIEGSLNLQQARLVLGYLEGALRPRAPRPPAAPAPPPPASPASPSTNVPAPGPGNGTGSR